MNRKVRFSNQIDRIARPAVRHPARKSKHRAHLPDR
jgi:hypothetical protein